MLSARAWLDPKLMMQANNRTLLIVLLAAGGCVFSGCSRATQKSKRSVEEGKQLFQQKKYQEALAAFRRAVNEDLRNGEAYCQLVTLSWDAGVGGQLAANLHRCVELQPDNADAIEKLGELQRLSYEADPDPRRRESYLDEMSMAARSLLRIDNRSFEGLRLQGYLSLYQKEYSKAVSAFRDALVTKPDAYKVAAELFNALVYLGSTAEAEAFARDYLRSYPTAGPLYDAFTSYYMKRDRLPEAGELLSARALADPANGSVLRDLANIYRRTGRKTEEQSTLARLVTDVKTYPDGPEMVGAYYVSQREYEAALRTYESGESRQPDRKNRYRQLIASVFRLQGRTADAQALVSGLLATDTDPETRLLFCQIAGDAGYPGGYDAVLKHLDELRPAFARDARLWVEYGRANHARGSVEDAQEALQRAILLDPKSTPVYAALARVYETTRDFTLMRSTTETGLALNSDDQQLIFLHAKALMGLGLNDSAAKNFEKALALNPHNTDARYLVASSYFAQGKYREAEAAFRILADSGDFRGAIGLAQVFSQQKEYGAAVRVLSSAADRPGVPREISMAYAKALLAAGKPTQAIAVWDGLLSRAPKDVPVLIALADLHSSGGDYKSAMPYLKRAVEAAPRNPDATFRLAEAIERTGGSRQQAKELYESALRDRPGDPATSSRIARILADTGQDMPSALSLAHAAVRGAPANTEIAMNEAYIYSKMKMSEQAINAYQGIIRRNPNHIEARIELAAEMIRKGDRESARRELESGLRSGPQPEQQQRIQQILASLR
jgi:tetratricopeptide (TPR) repeat protein